MANKKLIEKIKTFKNFPKYDDDALVNFALYYLLANQKDVEDLFSGEYGGYRDMVASLNEKS